MSELTERVGRLDWQALQESIDERGYAITQQVLSSRTCGDLIALFDDDERYRSVIDMRRYRFGSGFYKYFDHPLPAAVRQLREALYPPLARIGNEWADRLGRPARYPPTLRAFLEHCHQHGQTRPTPLIFRYEVDDFNALHQDVYGAVGFPFQVLTVLSRRERDFTGGEFLLVTQRPRAQSVGEAISLEQGQLLIFPNQYRPVPSERGFSRLNVRHGVSRVRSGTRYTLGVIFHDAE